MNAWSIIKTGKTPKLKNPVLIEGLPGIGNVGKVAVDFIIDELHATKYCDFFSHSMPHSVFVNEKNLVELPTISVYFKQSSKGPDLLLVNGDFQPIDESSCYGFSEKLLDLLHSFKGNEIITLGGIGLPNVPKKPKIYCTGTSSAVIDKYKKGTSIEPNLYGVVGPIIGVSGLLLGLAKKRNMRAVSLLAETYGHPMYLGIRGAREVVKVLNTKLSLGISIKELDSEITELEAEAIKNTKNVNLRKAMRGMGKKPSEVSYIG